MQYVESTSFDSEDVQPLRFVIESGFKWAYLTIQVDEQTSRCQELSVGWLANREDNEIIILLQFLDRQLLLLRSIIII